MDLVWLAHMSTSKYTIYYEDGGEDGVDRSQDEIGPSQGGCASTW